MSDRVERKIGELNVIVDREACIGSGNCVNVAPQLFELDDEQIAAFPAAIPELNRDLVIEACEVCPVDALIVRDAAGKEIVP